MSDLPSTMRSLVAPKYCKPSSYEVRHLPLPVVTNSDEMLIQVHAAGLMTGDTMIASGAFRFIVNTE